VYAIHEVDPPGNNVVISQFDPADHDSSKYLRRSLDADDPDNVLLGFLGQHF
jgi:hypothetical protein